MYNNREILTIYRCFSVKYGNGNLMTKRVRSVGDVGVLTTHGKGER